MVVERGSIWWAELGDPSGSEPGFRRPVVVLQSNAFNRSRIQTTVVAVLTSNLKLLDAPGNVLLPASESGLAKDSVVNVSQILTLDKDALADFVGNAKRSRMKDIDSGIRLVLDV